MLLLSTLVACLHIGLLPRGGGDVDVPHAVFGSVDVTAPVSEPGVDEAVRTALSLALAARHGLGEGSALSVTIIEAGLEPALRGDPAGPGGGLWYRARLAARVHTPSRSRTFVVVDWVAETGRLPDRPRVYAALADRLSVMIAAWAMGGDEGPPTPDLR
ncbi:MAG: hypothetical protein EXR69_08855 [Myxococcales bacterium]|nr:hypothetical protein [Myxococcales bacterium]